MKTEMERCNNYNDLVLQHMDCFNFTLVPGDFLYLPQGTIHFATTDPGVVSAHMTVSGERNNITWHERVVTSSIAINEELGDLVSALLSRSLLTPLGMPWHFPATDPGNACVMLHEMVLGEEPWSLANLIQTNLSTAEQGLVSNRDIRLHLRQLGSCRNTVRHRGQILTIMQLAIEGDGELMF